MIITILLNASPLLLVTLVLETFSNKNVNHVWFTKNEKNGDKHVNDPYLLETKM